MLSNIQLAAEAAHLTEERYGFMGAFSRPFFPNFLQDETVKKKVKLVFFFA